MEPKGYIYVLYKIIIIYVYIIIYIYIYIYILEKEMATHSSILAQIIRDRGTWWAAIYGVAQSQT